MRPEEWVVARTPGIPKLGLKLHVPFTVVISWASSSSMVKGVDGGPPCCHVRPAGEPSNVNQSKLLEFQVAGQLPGVFLF